ncbi:MAG: hypothetical protein QOF18_2546 [Frankiaceae bacterium]|jgi:hypothetical protein|nr:hypothetical protein [Frankiaceae bacterium]
MTLYCSNCLITKNEMHEAVTSYHGHSVCVQHLAETISTPLTSEAELVSRFTDAVHSSRRFDCLGVAMA